MKAEFQQKNQKLMAQIDEIKYAISLCLWTPTNNVRRQRAAEEPQVEKLKHEVMSLNSDLKQMKAKGDQINVDVGRLKQERTDWQDKLVCRDFICCFFINLFHVAKYATVVTTCKVRLQQDSFIHCWQPRPDQEDHCWHERISADTSSNTGC